MDPINSISDLDENFDFDDVAITEDEYGAFLDSLLEKSAVDSVSHSVGLNEIVVAISEGFTGTISSAAFPDGITISHVGEWDQDTESDTRRSLRLRTTRWFGSGESNDEYFPGEYSDEAMAALRVELEFFDEVASTTSVQGDTGVHIEASLSDTTNTSAPFDEVQTILGYSISRVSFTDGSVDNLRFEFDESRVWSRENYELFQRDKQRWCNQAHVDQIEEIPLPCGHAEAPTTVLVSGVHQPTIREFPLVSSGDLSLIEYHKIPVEDVGAALLTVSEWPKGVTPDDSATPDSTPVSSERGILCEECSCFYAYSGETRHILENAPTVQTTDSTVSVNGREYEFTITPLPALPIGHRDAYPNVASDL